MAQSAKAWILAVCKVLVYDVSQSSPATAPPTTPPPYLVLLVVLYGFSLVDGLHIGSALLGQTGQQSAVLEEVQELIASDGLQG